MCIRHVCNSKKKNFLCSLHDIKAIKRLGRLGLRFRCVVNSNNLSDDHVSLQSHQTCCWTFKKPPSTSKDIHYWWSFLARFFNDPLKLTTSPSNSSWPNLLVDKYSTRIVMHAVSSRCQLPRALMRAHGPPSDHRLPPLSSSNTKKAAHTSICVVQPLHLHLFLYFVLEPFF